jgi:hypothetical protein
MATLGMEGTMGIDFNALLKKGQAVIKKEGTKIVLSEAQKQIDKLKPKPKETAAESASAAVANIVEKTGMPAWSLALGGICLLGVVGFLVFHKPKPKAAPVPQEASAQPEPAFVM